MAQPSLLQKTISSFSRWNRRRKAKRILKYALDLYAKELTSDQATDTQFVEAIHDLQKGIETDPLSNIESAIQLIEAYIEKNGRKSLTKLCLYYAGMLILALGIATIVRQTCWEMYEIPTGSMRPTFKERDRVLVSKTSFGLNIPLVTGHFAFSPDLVERGTIGIITGDSLDLSEVDTRYFGIFPGKRRYVKRIVGKPGDWIYFYGGDIFILEKEGKRVRSLSENPLFKGLEYIPFIHFEGKTELVQGSRYSRQRTIEIKQMNIPIGRIEYTATNGVASFVSNLQEKRWIPQFSEQKKVIRSAPQTVGDFWGIKNFAKAKLLLPQEIPQIARELGYKDPHAALWVELMHSPRLPEYSRTQALSKSYIPPVITARTWIPLHNEQCHRLMQGLYTARFVVQNGMMYRYHHEGSYANSKITPPRIVGDGIYEFYYGKAYKIGFGGSAQELTLDHPIYPKTAQELLFWYNIGIDMNDEILTYSPTAPFPTRHIYFKDGSLFSMGVPLWREGEALLQRFQKNEIYRQASDPSYTAFQDAGSPKQDLDPLFFQTYGLKIPEKQYLLLGDNHAMSIDSRYFGFVPEKNLEGAPLLLFWPFGERFGRPIQASATTISPYTISLYILIAGVTFALNHRNQRRRKRILRAIISHKK